MHTSELTDTLLSIAGFIQGKRPGGSTRPDSATALFIEKGHIMEYIDIGLPGQRIVPFFYGPKEFAVPCHAKSNMVGLDKVKATPFTHSMLFQTLRKFPESHDQYRAIRQTYHEKVAARLHSLRTMNEQQRYEHLVATQPWVLKLANPQDVALYLGISVDLLRQWKK